MVQHSAPLVGMHFRPPAKIILACLPAGCPLSIVPEPQNPYDENALAVFVRAANIPVAAHEQLALDGPRCGFELSDILAQEAWQLGYISAKDGSAARWSPIIKEALASAEGDPHEAWDAALAFDAAGKPLVRVELP